MYESHMNPELKPDSQTLRLIPKGKDSSDSAKPVEVGDIFVRKMKTFIHCMDMDGDGYLTKLDLDLLADRYKEVGKLDPIRAQQCRKQLLLAWDLLLSPGAIDGKLTAELISESLLRRGRDLVIAMSAICFATVFHMIDVTGSGKITRENFRLFHKLCNVDSPDITDLAFDSLDEDKNGSLNLVEFIQAGVDFCVSNDENSPYNLMYGPLLE